jgi:hypothetical protein
VEAHFSTHHVNVGEVAQGAPVDVRGRFVKSMLQANVASARIVALPMRCFAIQ